MTERQQTGAWFVITGVFILLFWFFAYPIAQWAIDSGVFSVAETSFNDEQLYVLGASSVVTIQLASLVGIPFIITGLVQLLVETKKSTKTKTKK